MINEFIADLCDELNISIPVVSYDSSKLITDTMLAMCDGTTIYLKSDKPSPDLLFSIAHELRHLWQIKEDEDFYFQNYKSARELTLEEYNLQIAEVDANAYASIVMIEDYKLQPLYHGLSDKVVVAIKKRIDQLLD